MADYNWMGNNTTGNNIGKDWKPGYEITPAVQPSAEANLSVPDAQSGYDYPSFSLDRWQPSQSGGFGGGSGGGGGFTPFTPIAPEQNPARQPMNFAGFDPYNQQTYINEELRGGLKSYAENIGFPLQQSRQNAFQYTQDFNEAARRFDAQQGLANQQFGFQSGLATRQQLSAEEQARIAAQQWAIENNQNYLQQQWEQGYANDALKQQGALQQMGYATEQNVANTYAAAQRYGAELGLQGEELRSYADQAVANTYAGAQRYGAELGLQGQLGSAEMYSGADRYGADQQLAGTLGSAQMHSEADKYGARLGLQGQVVMAGSNENVADVYAAAQRYGADMGLRGEELRAFADQQVAATYANAQRDTTAMQANASRDVAALQANAQRDSAGIYSQAGIREAEIGMHGTLGAAEMYSGAQRYQADVQSRADQNVANTYAAAQRYGTDVGYQIAQEANELQRYGIDAETAWRLADRNAQERMQQRDLETQRQIASMQAFGRWQAGAPRTQFVRNWS